MNGLRSGRRSRAYRLLADPIQASHDQLLSPGGFRRHLDTVNILWFTVLVGSGLAAFLFKDKQKRIATICLLVTMTVYVSSKYYTSIVVDKRLSKSGPTVDVDKAELMLRMGAAVGSVKSTTVDTAKKLAAGAGAPVKVPESLQSDKKNEFYITAEKIMLGAAKFEPDSAAAWAKLAVIQHECGTRTTDSLEHLHHIKTPAGEALTTTFDGIYAGQVASSQVPEFKKTIIRELPSGWFQEQALDALYLKANDKTELNQLRGDTGPKRLILFGKMVALLVLGGISFVVGVIIIFVQLLFIARKSDAVDESSLVKAPINLSPATIYGVFMGWQATQLMVGTILQHFLKSLAPLLKPNPGAEVDSGKAILIAAIVAVLYVLSNGPGTLYAYLVAMRPSKIGFFEGFRIRKRVGKHGLGFLVLSGIGTWFAAIPLVLVAAYIGSQLGSQGSSNPIIGLITDSAKSGNVLSMVIFYLTLGVLAPICEETLFRGFLYANLRRSMGVFPSMVISAGLFAGCHMDVGAFFPLFTLGAIFALVFEKQKSIIPSMIAHGLWNSCTFTLLLLILG